MDIVKKLKAHLAKGITTEADALYLLTEVRKLLEQEQLKRAFHYLTFHCDWTVHSKLEGPGAQAVLKHFGEANIHLRAGAELKDLPADLRNEIDRLSKLTYFKRELSQLLKDKGLPDLSASRPDAWSHFFHLYAKIIEDCPLVVTAKNAGATIEMVTVHFELAKEQIEGEMLYKITWTVSDKNGQSGDIFVINSFSGGEQ